MTDLFLKLHGSYGNAGFLPVSILLGLALSLWAIPYTTDLMVNAAAGLAGKHLGRSYRTMVINCSTNNPELASMLVAFAMARLGGIANPLGSNFANIYLMFLVALPFVLLRFLVRGQRQQAAKLWALVKQEKRLVAWHLLTSAGMFVLASVAYYLLTGQPPINLGLEREAASGPTAAYQPSWVYLAGAGLICLTGVILYVKMERKLERRRPELFEEIDEEAHGPSWRNFLLGTAGLVLACWVLNSLFMAASELYRGHLSVVLGATVFAGLHYFAGALVTSLPELTVAVKNYARVTTPDLNTAMASASTSNMCNLAIAALGCAIAFLLYLFGVALIP